MLHLSYLAPVHLYVLSVRGGVVVVLRRQRIICAQRSHGQDNQPDQRMPMGSRDALLNSGTRLCGDALTSVVWLRGTNGLGLPRDDVNPKPTSTK